MNYQHSHDSWFAFGVIHELGMLWKQRGSYILGTLIKNGQEVNDFSAIQNSYHQIKAEPEFTESALANFYAIESVKVVAHVDKVHSASAKNDPLLPDVCHADVLATW